MVRLHRSAPPPSPEKKGVKRLVKRISALLALGTFVAGVLRLRGRGGKPPTGDGWRELDITEGP